MVDYCVQHLYQGKLISIWVGWINGRPEEYVLGRSEKEVREGVKKIVRVDFYHRNDGEIVGTCPDYPTLEGVGSTCKKAEEALISKINLSKGVVDWKHIAVVMSGYGTLEDSEAKALDLAIEERKTHDNRNTSAD